MRLGWFEAQPEDLRQGDKVIVEWEAWDPAAKPSRYLREETVYDMWATVTLAGPAESPVVYTLMPDGWHEFQQLVGEEEWREMQVLSNWRPGPHGVIVLATPTASPSVRVATAPVVVT